MDLKAIFSFFFFNLSAKSVINDEKFQYRFEYTSYVKEVQNRNESPGISAEDVHICRLKPRERLKICEKALKEPTANRSEIEFVYPPIVHEEKVYEFSLTGWNHLGEPPLKAAACLCSTTPPIYLRDNSSGNYIDVFISFRDTYVKHIVNSTNFSFRFEHVVYARCTSAPVKPPSTKLRICNMKEEEKLQMCREMLAEPYAKNYGIEYVEGYGSPVLEERMYEIKLADFEHTFQDPLFIAACMCPTVPPTFLRCSYIGRSFLVYVVLRDELLLSETMRPY